MLIKLFNRVYKLTKGQLGLFGGEKKTEIQQPGSRGGEYYRTKDGKIRYGVQPVEKPKKTDEVRSDMKEKLSDDMMKMYFEQLELQKEKRLSRKKKKESATMGLFAGISSSKDAKKKSQELSKKTEQASSAKEKMEHIRSGALLDLFAEKKQVKEKAKVEKEDKENWEMTRDEYVWHRSKLGFSSEGAKLGHKIDVEQALLEGKSVSTEVLKDYPELIKKEIISDPVEYFKQAMGKSDKEPKMSHKDRIEANKKAREILEKPIEEISDEEKELLKKYTGRGGLAGKGEGGKGILNEYYTPHHVINFMYGLANKLGFKNGDILEPSCGTGKFIENAPEDCETTGIEIDAASAKIAQVLNENADIKEIPFELFNVANDKKYDLIIGNIPFGQRISIDGNTKLDMPKEKVADRYFIERSIDNAKVNGLVIEIAAHGMLTGASNKDFRKRMLRKAEFLGAIRLPTGTFTHTGVVADVLMFRKRPENIVATIENAKDTKVIDQKFYEQGKAFVEGSYFQSEHGSKNMIGKEGDPNDMYYKVKGNADTDTLIDKLQNFETTAQGLDEKQLKEMGYDIVTPTSKENELNLTDEDITQAKAGQLFVGMTKVINGRVYILNNNHRWERLKDRYQTDEAKQKFEDMADIHQKVEDLKQSMRDNMTPQSKVTELQEEIQQQYDNYEKIHGNPNEDDNLKSYLNEHRYAQNVLNIYGLKTAGKYSDLLTKENIFYEGSEGVKIDANDIVAVSEHLVDELDQELTPANIKEYYMDRVGGELANKSLVDIRNDLLDNDHIYYDGEKFYTADQFLEGDAYEKIDLMDKLIEATGDEDLKKKYQEQIFAIQRAAGFKTIENVNIALRDVWLPEDIVKQFLADEMDAKKLDYNAETGKWFTTASGSYSWDSPDVEDKRAKYYLNGNKQKEKNIDTEDYKQNIEDKFRLWISDNPDIKQRLEDKYNRSFHDFMVGSEDDHAVEIKGINPEITLNTAQKIDINFLYKRGKGISALDVGFGKTFSLIALSQYRKQNGLEKKAFFQVPNNKVKDWENDINKLFPDATIAVIDSEVETTPEKLHKKLQDISKNDYDFVVCAESKAVDIGVSKDFEQKMHEDMFYQMFHEYKPSDSSGDRKDQEKLAKFYQRVGQERKTKIQGMTFEDLGCDAFYTDEAHHLKNLWKPKQDRNKSIMGLNLRQDSTRSLEAWKKCEFIRRNNSDKGVFFGTATPFTNTALEFYNMLSHIAPEELKQRGLTHIDDFISYYAVSEKTWVPSWTKDELVEKDVFKDYKNIDELHSLLHKYVDFQRDVKKANLVRPEAKDRRHYIQPSLDQLDVVEEVRDELKEWQKLSKEKRLESGKNALTFWSQFRTMTMDLELHDSERFKDWVNPKVKLMAETARQRYAERGAGQVVFCDRVFNSKKDFNFHDKIKKYLIDYGGFKENEIAVVNGFTKGGGAKSDSAIAKNVDSVIKDFNSGKIKMLLGTTWTLGEGVNIQSNASDLYHLDIPYRPSDYNQRNGRIHRQGNQQSDIQLHYSFGTGIDSAFYDMVSRKEDMIGKLLETKERKFGQEDMDEINYMSPLGMQYMTSTDEDEKEQIRQEFRKQKEEKIIQKQHDESVNQFKKYLQIQHSMSKLDKQSAAWKTNNETAEQIRSQLEKNPQFRHHNDLDYKQPALFNMARNELLKVGNHITVDSYRKGETELYKITEIKPGKGTFTAESATGKTNYRGDGIRTIENSRVTGAKGAKTKIVKPDSVQDEIKRHKIFDANLSSYDSIIELKRLNFTDAEMEKYKDTIDKAIDYQRSDYVLIDKDSKNYVSPYTDDGSKYQINTEILMPTAANKEKIKTYLIDSKDRDAKLYKQVKEAAYNYFGSEEWSQITEQIK